MEKGNRALAFDVQRYSLHDGPGVRTMVFLKGCPLRCLWCCNPESQEKYPETEFYKDHCRSCGACLEVCKHQAISLEEGAQRIDKEKCVNCGACVAACNFDALRTVGKWVQADEVLKEIKKDAKLFRKSGGGVTLSGGEALLWIVFCEEILKNCYDLNINTAIETCGQVPTEYFQRVKDYVDVFLYDIKSVCDQRHKELTGVSNQLIQKNIRYLREYNKDVIIRVPLIPEHNFFEDEIQGLVDLAEELGIKEINFMPYHNLGEVKYERLFKTYALSGLESLKFAKDLKEQMEKYNGIFEKHKGITIHVG